MLNRRPPGLQIRIASLPVSRGVLPERLGSRNAQSVAYAAFSPSLHYDPTPQPGSHEGMYVGGFFWDGRGQAPRGSSQGAVPESAGDAQRRLQDAAGGPRLQQHAGRRRSGRRPRSRGTSIDTCTPCRGPSAGSASPIRRSMPSSSSSRP
ncbi:MAG: cytochrome-c peroxidase [Desulfobacterales bacterium]|nr:cytochrome-c peroxidase [Desulfobacterales bacterium]